MMSGTNSRSACSKRPRVSTRLADELQSDFVRWRFDQRGVRRHVFQQQDP